MNPVRLHLTSELRLMDEYVCMVQPLYKRLIASWSLTG